MTSLYLPSIPSPGPLSSSSESTVERPISPRNFVSEMVAIVRANAVTQRYDLLDAQLASLASEAPPEVFSAETLLQLTQTVKEMGDLRGQLPTIYKHLIADFHVQDQGKFLNNSLFATFSEEFRVECAKMDLKKNVGEFSAHLAQYGIRSQTALIQLAVLAAQEDDGWAICEHISKYQIQDVGVRITIAQSVAKHNGGAISTYIKNFNLSETTRIAIAKQLAASHPEALCEFIQNFEISDEAVRFEIAQIAAENDGQSISEHIKKFQLNEAMRIDIAMMAMVENSSGFCIYVQEYEIQAEDTRKGLAKYAAKHEPLFSAFLENFEISNPDVLAELGLIAAEHFPLELSAHLENYEITDETIYLSLACTAARKNPAAILLYFKNYNLNTLHSRLKLFEHMLTNGADISAAVPILFSNISEDDFLIATRAYPELRVLGLAPNVETFPKFLAVLFDNKQIPASAISAYYTEYTAFLHETDPIKKASLERWLTLFITVFLYAHSTPTLMVKLFKTLNTMSKITNLHVKDQQMLWLAGMLALCRIPKIPPAALVEREPLIEELLDLRDPGLRSGLTKYFVASFARPILKGKYLLPAVVLGTFTNPTIKEITDNKYFKDGGRMLSLMRCIHPFMETKELTDHEKKAILEKLVFVKKTKPATALVAMQLVAAMIEGGHARRLVELLSPKQLDETLKEILASTLHLDVTDFNRKYLSTFGSWRRSGSFLIYLSKIQTLKTEERTTLLSFLKTYATAVLEGNFAAMRYDTSSAGSEHLQKLGTESPELLKRWKQGYKTEENGYDIVDTDDPCDLLLCGSEVGSCQSVDKDPYYSKCLVNYLLDGKVRMMAVKNKQGVVVARCMLRLLWDQNTQQFALFQELSYPKVGNNSKYIESLNRACIERAKQLGVSLLIQGTTDVSKERTTLQAFKSKTPFEYVDALGHEDPDDAIKTDAGYEIPDCEYVYKH